MLEYCDVLLYSFIVDKRKYSRKEQREVKFVSTDRDVIHTAMITDDGSLRLYTSTNGSRRIEDRYMWNITVRCPSGYPVKLLLQGERLLILSSERKKWCVQWCGLMTMINDCDEI